ncbi:MAG: carboxymuconolactone decarboxylase family protein [Bacteroidetes bacterium]|nr:MAG: carboxymuconolactone decarboxylase family protein [Bacteroidota bacterium]
MESDKIDRFNEYRELMNERLLAAPNNKILKRIFSVDTLAYMDGALNSKTKELLGLVASMVLRCDDCIAYHLQQCYKHGATTNELLEVFGIANLVGGSIVIPHTRRALEFWEELNETSSAT